MGTPIYELITPSSDLLEKSGGKNYIITETAETESHLLGSILSSISPSEQGSMVMVTIIPSKDIVHIYAGTLVNPINQFRYETY